jgi:hypothetical protein
LRTQEPRIHDEPSGEGAGVLDDFPLHPGIRELPVSAPASASASVDETAEEPDASVAGAGAAPLAVRWTAAAADAALVLLLTAISILAARWATGRTPAPAGIAWAAAFLVFLSFFATVPALVLFGRTVGMALADLSVSAEDGASGLDASEAVRRWLGTLATGLSAGLPLLWTARDAQAPTPADRLSGRALAVD